jgi:hypothetical protein
MGAVGEAQAEEAAGEIRRRDSEITQTGAVTTAIRRAAAGVLNCQSPDGRCQSLDGQPVTKQPCQSLNNPNGKQNI